VTLSIFVCEDDFKQRKRIESVICDYSAKNGDDIELTLSTGNPTEILKHLESHFCQNALYILDVDLRHEINGIVLASKIRQYDALGKIIFVTTHAELSYLTFRYKVEAMDYIIKDSQKEIAERIEECIRIARSRYLENTMQKETFQVKTGDSVRNIPTDDIIFFESHHMSHKLILHTKNMRIEFYGSLGDISNISTDFFRCHKSFVINVKHVKYVNKTKREVEMTNDRIALIAAKKIRDLLVLMQN